MAPGSTSPASLPLDPSLPLITGTGLFTPPRAVSNEALVATFNRWVESENRLHADAIARGERAALQPSSAAFIVQASGIESRYAIDPEGILDPAVMAPRIAERPNESPSLQCEMATTAAAEALAQARIEGSDVDAVIVACSNLQRSYPAVAIEVQHALGAKGFGLDVNVACSSATFGLQMARDMVRQGTARTVLMVNPEICTAHLNFRDRDNHFIFGDACTAVVVQHPDAARTDEAFAMIGAKVGTRFSSNIRNNAGFLNRAAPEHRDDADKLFVQQGRKVFKDVVPMVAEFIAAHLDALGLSPSQLARMWLHQANLTMNQWIAKKVLGREPSELEAPNILAEYANTSSAGSVIAFHKHRADLQVGDLALLCSFGAGYSVGNVVLRKVRVAGTRTSPTLTGSSS